MSALDDECEYRDFALQVFQQMRSAGISDASYDPDEFAIRYGDGVVQLQNLYRETRGLDQSELRDELARIVPALVAGPEAPSSWDEVRPLLRPMLRAATYLTDDAPRLRRPLFPFIDEIVAIDLPEVVHFPARSILAEWDVTEEEVFDAARENIAEMVAPMEISDDGVAKIVSQERDFLPSWLLAEGWLASATRTFRHTPVVFVPDQQSLLVVPGDPELVASVYDVVEQEYREATRPLSPQGYTLDADGGVVAVDQLATAHRAPAQRARALLAGAEYDIQREWLAQKYEDELDPGYVSSLMVVEQGDGLRTVTVWGEDVDCVLPEADALVFACDDGRSIQVPFRTAVDITGITPVPGLRPPRYRTNGWPLPEVLARLAGATGSVELPTAGQRR